MGVQIHARRRDGQMRFRLYSSNCDSYVSPEMSEEEMRRECLFLAIDRAFSNYRSTIERDLQTAQKRGTTLLIGQPWDLNGPWEEELTPYASSVADFTFPSATEIAHACRGVLEDKDCDSLAVMREEWALRYAIDLLIGQGVNPEEFLKQKGIL